MAAFSTHMRDFGGVGLVVVEESTEKSVKIGLAFSGNDEN